MATLGKSPEFGSSDANRLGSSRDVKANLKHHMDREYKLVTSNRSPPQISNRTSGEDKVSPREKPSDTDQKPFEKSVSERLEAILGESKQQASSQDKLNNDSNHYKQGLQNLRASLNDMKEKQQKNAKIALANTAKNIARANPGENATGFEKERIKRLQNEREDELVEDSQKLAYPNLEKNPVDSVGKKKALISYERKEREVHNKMTNNSREKDYDWQTTSFSRLQKDLRQSGSHFNQTDRSDRNEVEQRSPRDLRSIDERQERDNLGVEEADYERDGSYFTNKNLVRAKYEKYEEELEKRIQKGNQKKFSKIGGILKTKQPDQEETSVQRVKNYVGETRARNPEEEEQRRIREQIDREYEDRALTERRKQDWQREKADGFQRASEKKDQTLKDEYDSLEKQKGWSSRGLVYRDGLCQAENSPREYIDQNHALYSTRKSIKEEILSSELQKLREENQRIKNEIVDIHKRNNIDKRCHSAKLTKGDLKASYQKENMAGSMRLKETKKRRDHEDMRAHAELLKGDDIKKTIQKARKSVHEKLEINKQERTWSEAKKKKSIDFACQEMYLSLRDTSFTKKFNAGTPKTHLRESAYLLANGIPTSYMSDRSLDKICKSSKRSNSRSFRK